MATLTVNLPQELKALAESRASAAGCADVSEYLARLIEADADTGSDPQLETLLLSRVDGASVEMDADDFARLRKKLTDRL